MRHFTVMKLQKRKLIEYFEKEIFVGKENNIMERDFTNLDVNKCKIYGGAKELETLKLDFNLPDFLENDINEYVKAFNSDSLNWDCWWGEVYGSINLAQSRWIITEEQADMLRNHYLFKKGRE